MNAWLLIAIAFSTLWTFWQLLNFVFDQIRYWQASADRRSREAEQATRERGG